LKTSDKTIDKTVIISSSGDTFGRDYFNGKNIYWGQNWGKNVLDILRRLDVEKAQNCL